MQFKIEAMPTKAEKILREIIKNMVSNETKISQINVFDKGISTLPQMQLKSSMCGHILLFLHIAIIIQKSKTK